MSTPVALDLESDIFKYYFPAICGYQYLFLWHVITLLLSKQCNVCPKNDRGVL